MRFSIITMVAFATLGLSSPGKIALEDIPGIKFRSLGETGLEARQQGCVPQGGGGCRIYQLDNGLCCCTQCSSTDCRELCGN
ncbi:hypothetical protein HBI56_099960 [Parastagonospora nodorum]|nr:hypothetical protein HBH51_084530 [Parastagonospora nodorum]KAH3984984.1 hypothetical protein HBH52_051970 [Parastagonospora nodorum]KAH4006333.1 hypothetical protein HBI10_024120 [Parastagonospora nodorum]KAH4022895.1 hypothetical protein HBI13_091740 [Parastagonospora nodorum]KAH4038998.1 hypothetical protein HBI09_042550 [Parastagonospora nodorum]